MATKESGRLNNNEGAEARVREVVEARERVERAAIEARGGKLYKRGLKTKHTHASPESSRKKIQERSCLRKDGDSKKGD